MASIAVLGASGMLVSSLVLHLRRCGHHVSAMGRKKTYGIDVTVDFSDADSLEQNQPPIFIIK